MRFFKIALFMTLFAAGSTAVGQTKPGDIIADVPFPFAAAGRTLPAGHYLVKPAGDAQVMIVDNQAQGVYVSTHSASRTASDGSKLVFHRYADVYFLSAVWVTGNTTGRELPRSPQERELANHKAEMELAVVRSAK